MTQAKTETELKIYFLNQAHHFLAEAQRQVWGRPALEQSACDLLTKAAVFYPLSKTRPTDVVNVETDPSKPPQMVTLYYYENVTFDEAYAICRPTEIYQRKKSMMAVHDELMSLLVSRDPSLEAVLK